MKVIIYARVSTSTQDYERQLYELRSYSKRMGYEVVKEFSEKISGAKKVEEREALTDLLNFVRNYEVDKALIYECSRLSRRAVDFLSVIELLSEQGCECLYPPERIGDVATGRKAQSHCTIGVGDTCPIQLYGTRSHPFKDGEWIQQLPVPWWCGRT